MRQLMLKIAGKDNFVLDERISTKYLIRVCFNYGTMLIRGLLKSVGNKNISRDIFVGRKVRLYEKNYLSIGSKAKIHDGVKIDALSTDGVSMGKNVVIGRNSVIECTGNLQKIGKGIKIGNGTTFGGECFFGAAGGIEIGEDVVAGQNIRFHSENHVYEDLEKLIREQGVTHKGITVGNNCWIGSGVVFLDGAKVGNGCVIAANAVVTKEFPDNCVIGGIPAKLIKKRV